MIPSDVGRIPFSELCDLIAVQCDPGDVPDATYLGLEHLASGRLRQIAAGRAADVQSHKFAFQTNDVLYGKLRPYLDKAVLAGDDGVCTTELLVLRAKPGIDPRYLACVVHTREFIEHAMSGVTGAHHPRTSWQHIAEFETPKFDLQEQSAVAGLLWKVQDLLVVCESAAEHAQELKQATMRELFTRGLRGEAQKETEIGLVPESWEPRTILELCEIWSGGTPRKSIAEYWNGDIPWVSGKDLKLPALDDAIDHISAEGVEAASRLAPQGAVLLLVRGMGLAKDLPVAVINRPMAFNQDVKGLVSRGEYSGAFLRSAIYAGKERLLSQIVASAHGTMTLNLNDVENFKVACPSDPDEATEIVTILDALDRKIALHRQKRAVLEELFQSLLHKLMTGELRVADLDLSALAPRPVAA
ncbi:MAG: restriction endonuclease subunit S [Proteobacteria bacterium]|nr:restriction endonuclease subunit S [Pseudomonadota bacterium]